jgi:small subunit ribosomal protein S18
MFKNNVITQKRYCHFCMNSVKLVDFKNIQLLQRFLSSYGKIVPRKRSGVCAKHQRKLATAIKRGRFMALLPFSSK